jgi:iron complex transport system substrate-binding protein
LKRSVSGLLSAVVLTAVAACGGGTTSGGSDPAPSSGTSAAFPVTVDTMFGQVTVEKAPTRVVALGWSDAETALALGVQPVGASDWLAFGGEGVGPWAKGLYTTPPTILGTLEISYEAVAALQPDLILNTRSDNDRTKYDTLSKIAPTISAPEGVIQYGTTWRQQVELVSTALGKASEGEKLVSDVEARFTAAKQANPAFAGKQVVVGAYYGGKYGAYVSGDARVDFMTELGFTNKKEIQDIDSKGTFYVDISSEQLAMYDSDLTVMFPIGTDAQVLRDDTVLNSQQVAKDGHLLILDDAELVSAFSSGSTLGTSYAIEKAVPLFAGAVAK